METGANSIDLYYFTGTGNTLYLANQLKLRVPEINLIPIVPLLKKATVFPGSKAIGLCFPNHAGHLPIPMRLFIENIKLVGDEYLFAICNSAFSKCFAPDDINRVVKKSGCELSAYFNLLMPDNHSCALQGYKAHSDEEYEKFIDQAQSDLAFIKTILIKKERYFQADDKPAPFPRIIDKVLVPMIYYLNVHHPASVLKGAVYADSKCVGCKTCQKICPADRIRVKEKRPEFDHTKTCFGCYGCINFCPKESIQLGSKWYNGRSYTPHNGRYPHPFAGVRDMLIQKKAEFD